MTYFDFNQPLPVDIVNLDTQLNGNWDEVELKLNKVQQLPFPVGEVDPLPVGFEGYYPEGVDSESWRRIAVWTGIEWRRSSSYRQAWQPWISLEPYLETGRSFRPGYLPQIRFNTALKKVELKGSVRVDSLGSAWPVSSTGCFKIPYSVMDHPVNGEEVFIAAVDHTSAESSEGVRSARVFIVDDDLEEWTRILVTWQGDVLDSNNSVYLDNMHWWTE